MNKILVTGGAGFIGSALIRIILSELPSSEIINLDALTYAGNMDNLQGLDTERHTFVQGDIANPHDVSRASPEDTYAIVNIAAETHVDRSISSAEDFLRTNIIGTQVLLDAARMKNVKRFLQVSTDEVMGSLPDDSSSFFTESSSFAPNSPYAASKASAEHFVRAAHHTFGLDTVITGAEIITAQDNFRKSFCH